MARYFFHLIDQFETEDHEGEELPDLAAARQQAISYARDLIAEAIKQGQVDLTHRIVVENEINHPC